MALRAVVDLATADPSHVVLLYQRSDRLIERWDVAYHGFHLGALGWLLETSTSGDGRRVAYFV
eukprot:CAMPEP_0182560972 /NCGR_PEP_ID=MMETSP1324-20130603/3522_1 /TAXON_ID=236786 /ORGANISM="Florenciella sp., Strain RCC1587" /LENGTH=62 /DNA_ID=CAMNT_0024773445 /DNA_START=102 /DNA_END=290 /DNA_ORIENTATION=-